MYFHINFIFCFSEIYKKRADKIDTSFFNVYASHIEQPLPQFPPQQQRRRMIHRQLSLPQPLPHPPQPLPPQPPQQQRRRMIQRQELFSPHPFPFPPHPQLFVHPLSQPHPQFVAVNSLIVKSSERFLIYNVIVCG